MSKQRMVVLGVVALLIAAPGSAQAGGTTEQPGAEQAATKPHLEVVVLGHEGHGKTTLIAAITRVLSRQGQARFVPVDEIEAAPSERDRGLVLSAAQVDYETASRRYSHVDPRGHADFVKTIIAGATPFDGAILVVAATEGPMPQTRDQLRLARQANVPVVVGYLNKCDLVDDPKRLDRAESEVRELLSSHGLAGDDVPIIRGSALQALQSGDPESAAGKSILQLLKTLDEAIPTPVPQVEKDFLMAIEDIFSIAGRGTVVAGRVERGAVEVGEEVEIVGIREPSKAVVAGVEMFRKLLQRGEAGDNLGVLLPDIAKDDVERGQVLAKPGSIAPHASFRGEVYLLSKEEGGRHTPFFDDYRPQFYFRTTDVTGRATIPEGMEMVLPGDQVSLEVELIAPIAMEQGSRFSIREGGRTVGVGIVTGFGPRERAHEPGADVAADDAAADQRPRGDQRDRRESPAAVP